LFAVEVLATRVLAKLPGRRSSPALQRVPTG